MFSILFLRSDGADARGPVSEGVPLALDAGVVSVEGLSEADDVQAGLIGQLGQNLSDLYRRFACDNFFPHVAVYCRREKNEVQVTFNSIYFSYCKT